MILTFDLLFVSLGTQLVTNIVSAKKEERGGYSNDFSRYFELFSLSMLSAGDLLLVKLRIINRR